MSGARSGGQPNHFGQLAALVCLGECAFKLKIGWGNPRGVISRAVAGAKPADCPPQSLPGRLLERAVFQFDHARGAGGHASIVRGDDEGDVVLRAEFAQQIQDVFAGERI